MNSFVPGFGYNNRMDELDEILDKEEELYDDLIEPEDKLRQRHPLFLFLAIIALIAIIFFAIHLFLGTYIPWRKSVDEPAIKTSKILVDTYHTGLDPVYILQTILNKR